MHWTPLRYAAIAVTAQTGLGLLSGNWWLGGVLACTWWIAREHTQAEYRWIERFGWSYEACEHEQCSLSALGGFDPRAWTLGSGANWLVPVIVCAAAFLLINPG